MYIKTKNTRTNIYIDKATKLDILMSTVKKLSFVDLSVKE